MAIDNDGGVDPDGSCVFQVVFDAWRSGGFDTSVDAGRDCQPSTVADCCDALVGVCEVLDEFFHRVESPEFVGHEAAWEQNGIKVFFMHLANSSIGFARVAVFSSVKAICLFAGHDNHCSFLDQAEFWVPEFQVFINIANEGQNAFAGEFFIGHDRKGFPKKTFTSILAGIPGESQARVACKVPNSLIPFSIYGKVGLGRFGFIQPR